MQLNWSILTCLQISAQLYQDLEITAIKIFIDHIRDNQSRAQYYNNRVSPNGITERAKL